MGELDPYALLRPSWKSAGTGLHGPPGSGARGGQRCHPRAQAPQPHPPGTRSIPATPASLPRRAAGAGGGARRLRSGWGGLLGSLARIKYLLCFVWPLGEGQGGRSHRSRAACKARPGGRRGWRPGPAPPTSPLRAGPSVPPPTGPPPPRGEGLSLTSRQAALTDLGYRAGSLGPPWKSFPPRGRPDRAGGCE